MIYVRLLLEIYNIMKIFTITLFEIILLRQKILKLKSL